MTREDRDLIQGWQAAQRGLPPEPHAPDRWQEGYQMWLETQRRKRLQQLVEALKVRVH